MENSEPFELYNSLVNEVASGLKNVVLLSSSVARCDILKGLGVNVIVRPQNVTEDNPCLGNAKDVSLKNAISKMNSFIKKNDLNKVCYPLLSADTVISLSDAPEMNKKIKSGLLGSYPIIGKAENVKDAFDMLSYLVKNRFHSVFTSMVLSFFDNGKYISVYETDTAVVEFREDITLKEIADYIDTSEWVGAAGAYRIQGEGSKLIKRVYGDIGTVIGLSYKALYSALLKKNKEFFG